MLKYVDKQSFAAYSIIAAKLLFNFRVKLAATSPELTKQEAKFVPWQLLRNHTQLAHLNIFP